MSSSTYTVVVKDGLVANSYLLTLDEAQALQFELKILGYQTALKETNEREEIDE